MFKLAIDAGHGIKTFGKRCNPGVDVNQTREWSLNSRIANKLQSILSNYNGIEIIRVDDVSGNSDISLANRVKTANNFNANFYLSIHHNAGARLSNAGGTEVYTYTNVDSNTTDWQNQIYSEVINNTGLRGNRSQPCKKANFYVLRKTKMSAVLIECGFMDSKADTPIILTEDFANKVAQSIANVIIRKAGLTKKVVQQNVTTSQPTNTSTPTVPKHRVGERVKYRSFYKSSTDPVSKALFSKNWRYGVITKVLTNGCHNPYLIGNGTCWINDGDIH